MNRQSVNLRRDMGKNLFGNLRTIPQHPACQDPVHPPGAGVRRCLGCNKEFKSAGPGNRFCRRCADGACLPETGYSKRRREDV
jgi:hypothetical protein